MFSRSSDSRGSAPFLQNPGKISHVRFKRSNSLGVRVGGFCHFPGSLRPDMQEFTAYRSVLGLQSLQLEVFQPQSSEQK
jgi:hypothetical protein